MLKNSSSQENKGKGARGGKRTRGTMQELGERQLEVNVYLEGKDAEP